MSLSTRTVVVDGLLDTVNSFEGTAADRATGRSPQPDLVATGLAAATSQQKGMFPLETVHGGRVIGHNHVRVDKDIAARLPGKWESLWVGFLGEGQAALGIIEERELQGHAVA